MDLLTTLSGALIVSATLFVLAWYQTQRTLTQIQVAGRNANDVSLVRSPTRFSSFELSSITMAILKKYILVYAGNVARLRADPVHDQHFTLPLILVRGLLEINNDDLEKFRNAVPLDLSGSADVSAVNPLFLVATTGPLVPYILAHPNCPIMPLGAVNTRNSFTIHDAGFCRDPQAIKATSGEGHLSYIAAFGGPDHPGQRRRRGVEFSITIKILRNGEAILSQSLSFLQFLSSSTLPKFRQQTISDEGQTQTLIPPSMPDSHIDDMSLGMSPQHPRQWAACCRDYNPIHISTLMAKLFGFRSVIAHGNHAVALVTQQLCNGLDHREDEGQKLARKIFWASTSPLTVDVKFVKPMVLPILAQVHWYSLKEQTMEANFEIYKGSTRYIVGSCSTSILGQ